MLLQQKPVISIILLFISMLNLSAQDIAIFVGNYTTLSEEDSKAFHALFAREYSAVTNKNVYDISRAQEIFKENNYNVSATSLTIQVSEYIVITAVTVAQKILLDAVLYDTQGNDLLKVENSVVSMEELPDACTLLATSLASNSKATKTQKAEMKDKVEKQENQEDFFEEKIIGFKTGFIQPYYKDTTFDMLFTVGFNMKVERQKFFIEFGAGPLLPSIYDSNLIYGGVNSEFGVCLYLSNNPAASIYLGGGLNPRILFRPTQTVINPYISCGLMFMRRSSMRIFANLRVAQFIQELKFQRKIYNEQEYSYETFKYKTRPLELGLEVGIGW